MNNKGMTLVELLITFSLLMIIVVGMFNLILDVKMDLDDKQIGKDISEYSNFLNSDIHYELITRRPIAIAIKTTPSGNWNIKYNTIYDNDEDCGTEENPIPCGINGDNFRVNSTYKDGTKTVTITGTKNIANVCSNFFPCAVYTYYDSQAVNNQGQTSAIFKVIALNMNVTENNGYGVKYNNMFEEMPHYDQIDVVKTRTSMKFEGDFFVINYPVYITDDNTNYGFKIAYPVSGIAKTQTNNEENSD